MTLYVSSYIHFNFVNGEETPQVQAATVRCYPAYLSSGSNLSSNQLCYKNLNALLFETRVARSTKNIYMRSYVAIYFWCFLGPLCTFSYYFLLRPGTLIDGKLLIMKYLFLICLVRLVHENLPLDATRMVDLLSCIRTFFLTSKPCAWMKYNPHIIYLRASQFLSPAARHNSS